LDEARTFDQFRIAPLIAGKNVSSGLKIGPIAGLFFANDIRLNYEQYAGNNTNIGIASGSNCGDRDWHGCVFIMVWRSDRKKID
jgi:hypothetical protein